MDNKITLRQFMESGYSLLEVKRTLQRQKQRGLVFYPNPTLLTIGIDEPFELYLALKPILRCTHAFPVTVSRYRRYVRSSDQISYLKGQYERYYREPADQLDDHAFAQLKIYKADVFIWFYWND